MIRFLMTIGLVFGLFACGATSDNAETKSAPHSLALDDATKLPECTAEAEGWLVYLKAEAQFMACSSGAWAEVVIKTESASAGIETPNTESGTEARLPAGDPKAKKLKRGLTKADVQRILGEPAQVGMEGTRWEYSNEEICDLDMYGACFVTFDEAGLLSDLDQVKAVHVDVTGF